MLFFARGAGSAALVAACVASLAGCGGGEPDPAWASREGEALLARGNCTACHTADAAVVARVRPLPGPKLVRDGPDDRGPLLVDGVSDASIAAFLRDPHAAKPGTRMPHVLHGLDPIARDEAIADLVAFLAAQRSPTLPRAADTLVLPETIERGAELHRTIGCAACHGAPDLERHALRSDHAALAAYLLDPHAVHPGGLMPRVPMRADEADAIAALLVSGRARDADGTLARVRAPGLRTSYIEQPLTERGPALDAFAGARTFVHPNIDLDFDHREDDFAVRFTGLIDVPVDGEYEFHLGSDDGSILRIDGDVVVDNGGLHGMLWKTGSRTLTKGQHAFDLVMWEISGGHELELAWSGPAAPGPGPEPTPLPDAAFLHETVVIPPPTPSESQPDTRIARGREQFVSLGCAACHAPRSSSTAVAERSAPPPLAELSPLRGCLADEPPAGAPDFGLDHGARRALRETIDHALDLRAPHPPARFAAHATSRLGCITCHQRDGVGGPTALTGGSFLSSGSAELGDQGRLPPRLDGVGDKLRADALRAVLDDGTKVRPYMLTRMPVFGDDAVHGLADAFVSADATAAHAIEPQFSAASTNDGRALVGITGVGCVTCHTFNGRPSLGVPAVDLGTMHRRLRPGWFLAFLEHPDRFAPGTRMTRFWLPNQRIFPQYAGGDPAAQRIAIWNYLSLGDAMQPPPGLEAKAGQWDVVPSDEPIVFGTFMRDVSARTYCVGWPERVHVAFDAEHARLALAWRGAFIDGSGTWEGRAGHLSVPAGSAERTMPPGDAVAVLADRMTPWPDVQRLRWRGIDRDARRGPTFRLALGDIAIEERAQPKVAEGGVRLERIFVLRAEADRSDVHLRAAVGDRIEPADGGFLVDGTLRVVVPGATGAAAPFVRDADDGRKELLVPVDFKYVETESPRYRAVVSVELFW
jgi:mono/diheme cytochrome c family protein